ncbi:hypothetical protein IMSAGC008_02090 [Muribaculaceae bacterium]|nr:hypothetical protein IMSAGC008_02090 [Muribaculaceae bacterium]
MRDISCTICVALVAMMCAMCSGGAGYRCGQEPTLPCRFDEIRTVSLIYSDTLNSFGFVAVLTDTVMMCRYTDRRGSLRERAWVERKSDVVNIKKLVTQIPPTVIPYKYMGSKSDATRMILMVDGDTLMANNDYHNGVMPYSYVPICKYMSLLIRHSGCDIERRMLPD